MHAVVVRTVTDMSRLDEAVGGIEQVKQRLTGSPGFKQAVWMQPIDGHGLMMSLWEDEATARAAAPPVGFSPAPGVTVEDVDVRAVIAQA